MAAAGVSPRNTLSSTAVTPGSTGSPSLSSTAPHDGQVSVSGVTLAEHHGHTVGSVRSGWGVESTIDVILPNREPASMAHPSGVAAGPAAHSHSIVAGGFELMS